MAFNLSCESQQEELKLQPNPDISGVWVLINFIGTAHILVVVTFINYILAFNPNKDPYASKYEGASDFGEPAVNRTHVWRGNPVDIYILKLVRKPLGRYLPSDLRDSKALLKLGEACNKSLLTLCDVQLLTGLSIQTMAYYFLSAGLSAYHWQMAVYLTWFANVTHQAGLTALRGYLYRHPCERNLRAVFMAILSTLLLVSMVPTVYFNWPNSLNTLIRQYISTGVPPPALNRPLDTVIVEATAANSSSPAICYLNVHRAEVLFQEQRQWYDFFRENGTYIEDIFPPNFLPAVSLADTTAFQSTILSIFLLFFSLLTRSIKLFKSSSILFRTRMRTFVGQKAQSLVILGHKRRFSESTHSLEDPPNATNMRRKRFLVLYFYTKPLQALILTGSVYADMYGSMLSEVFWLIISATWGDLRVISLKRSVTVSEDDLTSGQFLSMLFFIGPVSSAVVSLYPAVSLLRRGQQPDPNDINQTGGIRFTPQRASEATESRLSTNGGIEVNRMDRVHPAPPESELVSEPALPSIQEILNKDYSEEIWAGPVMGLACVNVLSLTSSILSTVYDTDISAWRVFKAFVWWAFWVQPSTVWGMILLGLGVQESVITVGQRTLALQGTPSLSTRLRIMLAINREPFWWSISVLTMIISNLPSLLYSTTLADHTSNLTVAALSTSLTVLVIYIMVAYYSHVRIRHASVRRH